MDGVTAPIKQQLPTRALKNRFDRPRNVADYLKREGRLLDEIKRRGQSPYDVSVGSRPAVERRRTTQPLRGLQRNPEHRRAARRRRADDIPLAARADVLACVRTAIPGDETR